MRLGIDFGTTRIVVAFADRGNYPVVVFEAPDDTRREWFPPLVAVRGARLLYGWQAWGAQSEPGWTIVRSLKRTLEGAGPETRVQIGEQSIPMQELLRDMVLALRSNLLEHSSLPPLGAEPLEVMLGVPANANTNQRFLTTEAFRQAGFRVLGLLNEPSAASIEFGHRSRATQAKQGKTRILVYDLGGGTFDTSLVELEDGEHRVMASEGIAALGGDDFDEVLAELALDMAGVGATERETLSQADLFRLHEECREKKESLHPNSRRLVVDLEAVRGGWRPVTVQVNEYYERCRTLLEQTLRATEDLFSTSLEGTPGAAPSGSEPSPPLEALYVTGGGSELPLVSRMLREVFGRHVRRSAYTRSATAIGLAIQADAEAGIVLRDKFTRFFGVYREADSGQTIVFDPVFAKGTLLPASSDPPLLTSRRYFPAHNIGHFRYLECSHLSQEGRPAGDITLWDDIRFPFDSRLREDSELKLAPVGRWPSPAPQEFEESYSCDASAKVVVSIANLSDGYRRQYPLGRWAAGASRVVPGRRTKRPSPK
jgi:molecular chaperone DnaK (HSP70)